MTHFKTSAALAATCLALGVNGALASDNPAPVERGRAVYSQWCLSCHGPGQHTPGTMALFFKYEGKLPPLLEWRSDLTPQVLEAVIRHGVSVMPSFRKTEISDDDIGALASYLKHSAANAPKPPAR